METSLGDLAQFFPHWKVLWIVMSEGLAAVSGIMKDWYTLVSLLMLIVGVFKKTDQPIKPKKPRKI
jgi:hypothetical protein